MTSPKPEVWRWNVDPVWHHFSWMCQEGYLAEKATNSTFDRYHHTSACLYFGIGALEAFLNKKMRQRFSGIKTEGEIIKMLGPRTNLMQKVQVWPSVLCGAPVSIASTLIDILDDFREIRGEVTHQKRRDHSLFSDLDAMQPSLLVEAVSQFQIVIHEHLKEPFPYWLLGWNYIGMNNSPEAPCLLDNAQFRHSLRALGEPVPAWEYDAAVKWEGMNMTSWAGFVRLKSTLDSKPIDIEPFHDRFPTKPRLTRYWWDRSIRRG